MPETSKHDENTQLSDARREAARIIQAVTEGNPSLVIALVDALILHALAAGTSDIHILPGRRDISVRFRVDGILEEEHHIPLSVHSELIARLKILSNVRTDEHHAAQDGRFRFALNDERSIDVRISLAPTYYGENAVLRLLALDARIGSLDQLGFTAAHTALLEAAISRANGMILATGPTGSGKTTTLYALIATLTQQKQSIITIEDPIEYSMDGVSQIQVNARTGFTFAHGLRSLVRQDPDVIMVGEIRDEETARLACNAALTGHLVLSTLHTNDAATALVRLRDLGIESYLLASSVTLIIAQRLVRRICVQCSIPIELHAGEAEAVHTMREELGVPAYTHPSFRRGVGCIACRGTGYRGRVTVCELLAVDDALRIDLRILSDAQELAARAYDRGSVPLLSDALQKAADGMTTLEEIFRLRRS
jgi:type II secretory ATPase GspE/PulE/Tfp pilus assembly ATPase PilB-like protein